VPAAGGVNAIPERWVRSLKQECLSRLILFGIQRSLSRREKPSRERQPIALPEPGDEPKQRGRTVECRHRLGGLLKYYVRAA